MKDPEKRTILPPKWAEKLLEWYCKDELKEELLGDLQERFDQQLDQFGPRKAKIHYWLNVCLLMNRHTLKRKQYSSNNNYMLLGNYFAMAFRFMKKRPSHTFVNTLGLSIGLASCLLIFFYLQHEQNFDRFHAQSSQIYRVNNFFTRTSGTIRYPLVPPAVAPSLSEGFPEIIRTTRMRHDEGHWFSQGDHRFYEDQMFFADSSFFDIFSFEWVVGDKAHALDAPNQVVITEEMAQKYFGRANPIGEHLIFDGDKQLEITGILRDIPSNSHIHFDFLVSFATYEVTPGTLANLNSWSWLGFLTYVLVDPNTQVPELEEKLTQLYHDHAENRANMEVAYRLQPLTDIYLGSTELSNPHGGIFRTGNPLNIYALSIVGLLILFIAGFNFMNLSLAISTTRNKEVGVRKVLGATQKGLLFRFLTESTLIVLISFVLGILLMVTVAPLLEQYLGWQTFNDYQSLLTFLPILLGMIILLGILTGLYPSLVLARFKPVMVLKDQLSVNISGKLLRKSLIGLQFVISISLLISAVVITQQLQFIRNQKLGFDQEHVITTKLSGTEAEQQYNGLRQTLLSYPDILSMSRSSHIFDGSKGSNPMRKYGSPEDVAFQVSYFQVDEDFVDNMDIEVLEGRNFSREFPRDSSSSVLVNQALVKALELEDPIGQKVIFLNGQELTIIGVLDDFHYSSLHHAIGPFAFVMPFTPIDNVLIKISGNNIPNQLQQIQSAFQEVVPNQPFEYHFLDEKLDVLYEKEQKYASLITGFSILAILIASLGLYSLMTFHVRMRMREIGIRKVLGASQAHIMGLLSKQFIWIILISNVIAWPLSAYFMQKWLDNFAYSISLGMEIFIGAGLISMLIALFALSFQVIPGASKNPVNVLRI